MSKRRGPITAAELSAQLESDPEFVARRAAQEKVRLERAARLGIEEQPLVAALREVGCDVSSVWDLVNSPGPYPEAIPVLLKHLTLPYPDEILEGIARSLAVREPAAQEAWPMLAELYRKAPTGPRPDGWGTLQIKYALAVALAATTTEDTLDDLIALAKDRSHGRWRVLLLGPLQKRRNKDLRVAAALEELASDPDLAKEIGSWAKLKPKFKLPKGTRLH